MSMVSIICPSVKRLPSIEWVLLKSLKINASPYSLLSNHLAISPEWSINRGLEGWLRRSWQYIQPFGQGCTIRKMKWGGGGGDPWKGVLLFFPNQQGCKIVFPTLKTFFSVSFAMQDSFFLDFGFARFFFRFLDFPLPPTSTFLMVHP